MFITVFAFGSSQELLNGSYSSIAACSKSMCHCEVPSIVCELRRLDAEFQTFTSGCRVETGALWLLQTKCGYVGSVLSLFSSQSRLGWVARLSPADATYLVSLSCFCSSLRARCLYFGHMKESVLQEETCASPYPCFHLFLNSWRHGYGHEC